MVEGGSWGATIVINESTFLGGGADSFIIVWFKKRYCSSQPSEVRSGENMMLRENKSKTHLIPIVDCFCSKFYFSYLNLLLINTCG